MWWNELGLLGQVFFIIACVGTAFLLVQIVLLLVGGDGDVDGDWDAEVGDGLSLFTVKSITAFFAIGGWTGVVMTSYNCPVWAIIVVSMLAGVAALLLVAFIMKSISKIASDGTLQIQKLVSATATVYVGIPSDMSGKGKITLTAQGRYTELDAMTKENRKLEVDELVVIDEMIDDCAVVSPLKESKKEDQQEKE